MYTRCIAFRHALHLAPYPSPTGRGAASRDDATVARMGSYAMTSEGRGAASQGHMSIAETKSQAATMAVRGATPALVANPSPAFPSPRTESAGGEVLISCGNLALPIGSVSDILCPYQEARRNPRSSILNPQVRRAGHVTSGKAGGSYDVSQGVRTHNRIFSARERHLARSHGRGHQWPAHATTGVRGTPLRSPKITRRLPSVEALASVYVLRLCKVESSHRSSIAALHFTVLPRPAA